jgi:hypothetical protein
LKEKKMLSLVGAGVAITAIVGLGAIVIEIEKALVEAYLAEG